MIALPKLAGIIVLGAGGALVGALAGWNLGPLTLEVAREHLGLLGAGGGLLLALGGCCVASEYAEAHARNQTYVKTLGRLAHLGIGVRWRYSTPPMESPVLRSSS